jgi:hypothetical protein
MKRIGVLIFVLFTLTLQVSLVCADEGLSSVWGSKGGHRIEAAGPDTESGAYSSCTIDDCQCPCHLSSIEPAFLGLSSNLNIQVFHLKLSTLFVKDISTNIFRPPKTVL